MRKLQFFLFVSIFAIGIFASSVSFITEVSSASSDLQAGDMSILAEVSVANISIYSNGNVNVTAKIGSSGTNSANHALFTSANVKIISSTSADVLYGYFIQDLFNQYLATFQEGSVILSKMSSAGIITPSNNQLVVYSLSKSGFAKFGAIPTLSKFLPSLKGFRPGVLDQQISTSDFKNQYGIDIMNFAGKTAVNQTDFNPVGKEGFDQEKFKTGDVLSAGDRSYETLNKVNNSEDFDPTYTNYAIQAGILLNNGSTTNQTLRTEDLVGGTNSNTNYDVLTAGYNNFEKEAIMNPFIDYYVALQADNGTSVNPSDFYVNYNAVNNSIISQYMSEGLKTDIMSPIKKSIDNQNNGGFLPKLQGSVTLSIMGFNVYSRPLHQSEIQSITFGTPLLSLNSFTALSKATTISSVSNSVQGISKIKDMTGSGLLNAMTGNDAFSMGYARLGSKSQSDATPLTANPAQPYRATEAPVVQQTAVKSGSFFNFNNNVLIFGGIVAVVVSAFVIMKVLTRRRGI